MSFLVAFHIAAGSVALAAGVVSLAVKKGQPWHRNSGRVFVVTMMLMATTSVYLAIQKSEPENSIMGLLTVYLIVTAYNSVSRSNRSRLVDMVMMCFIAAVTAIAIRYGLEASQNELGLKDGIPTATFIRSAAIGAAFAVAYLRRLILGRATGQQRLTRHLWRICLAMFIATLSFFFGQAHLLPEIIRVSNLNFVPIVVVLGVMIYWLIRVSGSKGIKILSALSIRKGAHR